MTTAKSRAHHSLYYDLAGIVGQKYVSDDAFALHTYSRDCSPARGNIQGIVVRPGNIEQVVQIVKIANLTRIPIVPSGGRASLWGTPPGMPGKGIVIDMTRMNRLINIDEVNLTATAEAGMTTAELSCHVEEKGWDVHSAAQIWYPDTLGGQISGVMGGGVGLEMPSVGWNATHIAGIKVVLPNGNILQTGAGAGNNINNKMIFDRYPGNPDITGLFMGDGGIFGIKVEATYRMYRFSNFRLPKAYVWDSFEEAWSFLSELSTFEPLPYYFVVLIPPTNMTRMQGMGKYLVVAICKGNTEKEAEAKTEIVHDLAMVHKGVEAEGPAVEEWKQSMMTHAKLREVGQFGTPGVWSLLEFAVSRSQVIDCHHTMRNFIYDKLNQNGISHLSLESCIPVGAATWFLNTTVFAQGQDRKAMQVMQDIFYESMEIAAPRGWYSDCHQGYATRIMAKYWPKQHYDFMLNLKKLLDPNNIMNPGLWDL